jgi:hypothetical protein
MGKLIPDTASRKNVAPSYTKLGRSRGAAIKPLLIRLIQRAPFGAYAQYLGGHFAVNQ